MKSEWKVTSNYIGKTVYGVFRTIDINAVEHSGNREMHGDYVENRKEAEELAKHLNVMEEGGTHE